MTKIKLPVEIVEEEIFNNESDFEFEVEQYEYIEELDCEMDDDGRTFTYLYKRKSDGKHFSINVNQVRYGYENYGFEIRLNDCEFIEVEKREKVITRWEVV